MGRWETQEQFQLGSKLLLGSASLPGRGSPAKRRAAVPYGENHYLTLMYGEPLWGRAGVPTKLRHGLFLPCQLKTGLASFQLVSGSSWLRAAGLVFDSKE